jgi:hypothetical protein
MIASPPPPQSDRPTRWSRVATTLALGLLPLVLSLAVYYRAQLAGAPVPAPEGDATFYAYQLMRAAECRGAWWRIAEDDRIGRPYPTEFAKHPGLYEGVDLMLLATLIGADRAGTAPYHLAVLAVLAFNGWIAAWIVLRLTGRPLWAAVAVTLITLNQSVAARILGHLHLFKFGWALLSVWAFVTFLERPTWKRGLALGLAVALVVQGSFYLGFFTILGLGFCYGALWLAGRIERRHRNATLVAAVSFLAVGGALVLPVWHGPSAIVASDHYFQRGWAETWTYGSELWKYLVPDKSALADRYFWETRGRVNRPILDEGWNFPGYTVLLAVVVAAAWQLRGTPIDARRRRFVAVSLGLVAFWTVLSLSGGPSALLYHIVPSFRCYGRSGLLVVGLGSVVAPVILADLVRTRTRRLGRAVIAFVVLATVAGDARLGARSFSGWLPRPEPPGWVEWLRAQPPDVRLAVFPAAGGQSFYWWGVQSLEWLPSHGHATLLGGDFALFEADLRLLGASYEQMSPAGLAFVASLGYETMAFQRGYLAKNAWITSLPGLDRIAERGDWLVCRAGPRLPRLPRRTLDELLASGTGGARPREAPAGCWITGSWPVPGDTVQAGSEWALLAWTDDGGRQVSRPVPAFYQHVFGPSIPAYAIRTPDRAGSYRLVVLDRRLRRRASTGYQIIERVPVAQPEFPARRPGLTVHPVVLPGSPAVARAAGRDSSGGFAVRLENTSTRYAQALVFRENLRGAAVTHPGLRSRWPRADAGALVLRVMPAGIDPGEPDGAREISLPEDLAPNARLAVSIPADRLPPGWADRPLRVEPAFAGLPCAVAATATADVRISVEARRSPAAAARASEPSQTR